jgi:hypothetical protein
MQGQRLDGSRFVGSGIYTIELSTFTDPARYSAVALLRRTLMRCGC